MKLDLSLNNMKSEAIWPSSLILVSYWVGNVNIILFLNGVWSCPVPAGTRLLPASVGLQ